MGKERKERVIKGNRIMEISNYGVVYTPEKLAEFMVKVVRVFCEQYNLDIDTVLDPACGEGMLLNEYMHFFEGGKIVGIDIDKKTIEIDEKRFGKTMTFIHNDAICPRNVKRDVAQYWRKKLGNISLILANPPWSGEKVYNSDCLIHNGFEMANGQYDSYVLFIELAINLLEDNGIMSFIIPDSLFATQNAHVRKMLCERTQIEMIARLGEKIFKGVNRSTTIIICRKTRNNSGRTRCFRLDTSDRKKFLEDKADLFDVFQKKSYLVDQTRFMKNDKFIFDIDMKKQEEEVVCKIEKNSTNMNNLFTFNRGVEISKSGLVSRCSHCKMYQGMSKKHITEGKKVCVFCGDEYKISEQNTDILIDKIQSNNKSRILVGENIQRYGIENCRYIALGRLGINYKNEKLYKGKKILFRKTGLGINASIDYDENYVSQTVYILKYLSNDNTDPMEFYLALLNSRVIYFYYLKRYGENEWKSHPYFTKEIIFSLPVIKYKNNDLCNKITNLSEQLITNYNYQIDIELEYKICDLYQLTDEEKNCVFHEMNVLPDLGAINMMKVKQ